MNAWEKIWEAQNNLTSTENGDVAYKSTLNKHLDIFGNVNTIRSMLSYDESTWVNNFIEAYEEDDKLAIVLLFYLRDVRGGQGEKKVFHLFFSELVRKDEETAIKLIPFIAEYGSWKDVVILLGSSNSKNNKFRESVLNFIYKQYAQDEFRLSNGDNISLLAKWLPSVKTKNKTLKTSLNLIVKKLFAGDIAHYRKIVSKLRKSYNLFETNMTNKTYNRVDYSQVPSRALYKHQDAIFRNDETRYNKYLKDVSSGKTKLNASTLTPDLIVSNVLCGNENRDYLNLAWDNLSKLKEDVNKVNILPMIDVSGSMWGKPMEVAIGLGLYVAEQQKGVFNNKFLTFSISPKFVDVSKFNNICDKIHYTGKSDWGGNTNIDRAFKSIVDMATKYNIPKEQMPQFLLIISDMQFDEASDSGDVSSRIKNKFLSNGYEVPTIIFWNVASRYNTYPVEKDENGTILISGENPSIMNLIMEGNIDEVVNITPESIMLKALLNERYKPVLEALTA